MGLTFTLSLSQTHDSLMEMTMLVVISQLNSTHDSRLTTYLSSQKTGATCAIFSSRKGEVCR